MFCTQSFSIRFKRNGAQKLARSFGCLQWKRKSAKILVVASIFYKSLKERARFFAEAKEAFLRLYFCVKFEEPTVFFGRPIFTKMSQGNVSVLRRTEIRSLLLFCEKCEVPKNFQNLWQQISISVDFTNGQCAFNTDTLAQMFSQRNVKTPFLRDRL